MMHQSTKCARWLSTRSSLPSHATGAQTPQAHAPERSGAWKHGFALAATVAVNLDDLARLRVGSITGRLMGHALFGEVILLALGLAFWHRRAARSGRAGVLVGFALALLAVYVDACRVEPRMLRVRRHSVDWTAGGPEARSIRILHLTDIQAPIIGER
jgi:hypothetical protein